MNPNVLNGVLRAALPSLVAYAVGAGWLPSDTSAPDLAAAVITLYMAGWSIVSNAHAIDLNMLCGALRAIVPALVSYAVAKGLLPAGSTAPELTTAVVTLGAALWSVPTNLKPKAKS